MSEASHVQPADPRAWIKGLPRVVAPQAAVLLRLLDALKADSRIRAFRVRGSIARSTADEYSDLDTRASDASGRDQGVVVLLDRDGLFDRPSQPPRPWDHDLWLGWAWMALFDVDKHLRRDSLWEALTTLEKARSLLLRHHAAVTGMRDPEYGVTSILDYGGRLPEGLEATVAGLDAAQIRRAAVDCAELLAGYERRPFADFVMSRLATHT